MYFYCVQNYEFIFINPLLPWVTNREILLQRQCNIKQTSDENEEK